MRQFDKWMMPDNEAHLPQWMMARNDVRYTRLTYQAHKYDAAFKHCKDVRTAIDVGSHIGLLAFLMVHDFKRVECFEPMREHVACWKANIGAYSNAKLHVCALGEVTGYVKVETRTPDSTGDTGVEAFAHEPKLGYAPLYPLDDFALTDVDFIKIDCEGYELNVLKGAEKTLRKYKPVIMVEQKRDMSLKYGLPTLAAVDYLKSLGAELKEELSGDYIMAWA